MIKKILFLLLFILGFFLFDISKIKAEGPAPSGIEGLVPSNTEGICHINNCFVPAPTIVIPQDNSSYQEPRPVIRGLTWKRTLVDIYLDGKYQGPVLLKEHENHLQSFFWQPSTDLASGQHYVYTIAYSTKGYDKNIKSWDQSKESSYIYFFIKKKEETETLRISQQEKKVIANEKTSKDKNSGNISQSKDNQRTESPSDQNNLKSPETKNLNKEQPKNLGGIAIFKEEGKQSVLKIIGYLILGIIILIFIIKYYLDKKREYLNKIMAAKMKDEEDYPPPPPPLNQDSLGI